MDRKPHTVSNENEISTEERKKIIKDFLRKFAKTAASTIVALAGILPVLWVIFAPHVDGYIDRRAQKSDSILIQEFADEMKVDPSDVFLEVGVVTREHHTTAAMFDSLGVYKRYLDAVKKMVPEGIYWVNDRPYWFTGKKDRFGKPIKYRVLLQYHNGERWRYWIDEESRSQWIWSPKQ